MIESEIIKSVRYQSKLGLCYCIVMSVNRMIVINLYIYKKQILKLLK